MQEQSLSLSDEQLAQRARSGEMLCFEELVRRWQVPLVRFLSRRMGDAMDAEDVAQETFVRAYQNLSSYRSRWPFKTWLFTIGYRLAVSQGRKSRARENAESAVESRAEASTPPEQAEQVEQRGVLWEAARSSLSEEQFAAVWLFYVDEMPAGEIARVLGRSWVSVKTMLHRARKRLVTCLSPMTGREVPTKAGGSCCHVT